MATFGSMKSLDQQYHFAFLKKNANMCNRLREKFYILLPLPRESKTVGRPVDINTSTNLDRRLLATSCTTPPKYCASTSQHSIQLKLNGLRHSGQVLALLVLNHFSKQLAWNRFLHVGHRLVGSCLSALMIE